MQKVGLSVWTREEQQGFVVWVTFSRQEAGSPDAAWWFLSWVVLVWEGVLEAVAEDVGKREGWSGLLRKEKMIKRAIVHV